VIGVGESAARDLVARKPESSRRIVTRGALSNRFSLPPVTLPLPLPRLGFGLPKLSKGDM
jgi:hypothetical protein